MDAPPTAVPIGVRDASAWTHALAALASPAAPPGHPPAVERHETNGSWVFVADEHALKVKRPVTLGFLDYGTLDRRRAMCREKVAINRRLAPEIYLGTVGIVPTLDGGVLLTPDDEAPGTVEVGVLMRRYREAGGDPRDRALLALMGTYRALVRAKVDAVRGEAGRVRARIDQAAALAWRARGPLVLAVCGAPAAGKSTLARAACAGNAMVHLSSDVTRKASLGLAPGDRAPEAAYDRATTLATYHALGTRAALELAADRGAVVDATLGDRDARAALRDGLGSAAGAVIYVECRAPRAELERRARRREGKREAGSDATAAVAAALAGRFAALDEVPPDRHVLLCTDRPVPEVVAELAAAVDRRWL